MTTGQTSKRKNSVKLEKNALEWIVFGLSFILVLTLLAYLTVRVLSAKKSTPDVVTSWKKDPSENNANRIRITVSNKGHETAEEVIIETSFIRAGASLEQAELQIALLPKLSEKEGWVNFSNVIQPGDSISVKVLSYKKP